MQRLRILLALGAVFALLLVPSAAFAQDDTATDDTLTEQDRAFLAAASENNLFEIIGGETAADRAEFEETADFGLMLAEDHIVAQEELEAIAADLGVDLPEDPSPLQEQILEVVADQEGRVFDVAFLSAQVSVHQIAIALFEEQIDEGSNEQAVAYAEEYLPVLEDHLAEAETLLADVVRR